MELFSPKVLALLGTVSVVVSIFGALVTAWIVARIPADYFAHRERHPPPTRHPVVRVLLLLGKNVLGLVALLLGVVMAVPGVPGPGLVVILLALMLLDFPGKYAAERWVVSRKPVREAIDALRVRAGRQPLVMPTQAP
jgi:putative flippase GtrA